MATTFRQCSCVHAYQDAKYGRNVRLHNVSNKGPRCTVCSNEKNDGTYVGKKKK